MKKISLSLFLGLSLALHGQDPLTITLESLQALVTHASPNDLYLKELMQSFPLENYEIARSSPMGVFFIEKQSDDIIKRVIREGWYREGHLFWPLIPHIRPGSIVVDAGAHIGTHTIGFSHRVEPNGLVHAFEPQVKIFAELVVNMSLNDRNNIVFHRTALGNANGFIEMNPSCPSNEGGIGVGRGGDRAPLHRLDDFHLENVSVIKIDVEGMEMEVLEGALDTIQRNRPVMAIEIMNDVQERISQIEKMGYQVSHLGMEDYLCIPL